MLFFDINARCVCVCVSVESWPALSPLWILFVKCREFKATHSLLLWGESNKHHLRLSITRMWYLKCYAATQTVDSVSQYLCCVSLQCWGGGTIRHAPSSNLQTELGQKTKTNVQGLYHRVYSFHHFKILTVTVIIVIIYLRVKTNYTVHINSAKKTMTLFLIMQQ